MAHDPKLLLSILSGAAPPDLDVTSRAMFGGFIAYADGKPFASISDVGLALKFAGGDREAILTLPGAAPLRYEPDQPSSKSYVVLPDELLSDPKALRSWIVRSISSLPATRTRKRA